MSFVFFRKNCLEGQTQPPYPFCPAILPTASCFVIQSIGKQCGPSPSAFSTCSSFIGIPLEAGGQPVGHKCCASQSGVLGQRGSACCGRYASAVGLAMVLSTWKGRPALRQCGHAPNATVLLRVNPGKQKFHVKWQTLASCPTAQGALRRNDLSVPQPSTPLAWFPQGGTQELGQNGNNWTLAKALHRWAGARAWRQPGGAQLRQSQLLPIPDVEKGLFCHSLLPDPEHQPSELGHF